MNSRGMYQWLHDCQLDTGHAFYCGWADSRNLLIKLAQRYGTFDFSVPQTFMMTTPPPSSEIPMPVVTARSRMFNVAFVENWLMEPFFTVSISREFAGPLPLCGFVQPIGEDQPWLLRHMPSSLTWGAVSDKAMSFTGSVENAHILYGLFRILEYREAQEG